VTEYTGGIGRHYASLLPALVRAGQQVDLVILPSEPMSRTASGDRDGVNIITHRTFARVPRIIRPWLRAGVIARVYRPSGYDRIFLPEWSALGARLPKSAPLLTNLATSTRLSNRISGFTARTFGLIAGISTVVLSRLETRQIRRSRALIAISHAMLDWNRRELRRLPPAAIVRNCIDVDGVRRGADNAQLPTGWPTGHAPTVLFLGRLEIRKGVLPALKAFAHVARMHSSARLVLAGSPGDRRFEPTRSHLLDLVDDKDRDRVTFLGHVPGEELYRAVRESDVVICPSLWEGFGNVALEAKAIGTPVVVTSGSGFDDFCSDGIDALTVAAGDAQALATAIERILTDRDLGARLSASGLLQAEAFTADAVAPDLIAAASRLIDGPTLRSG
jgi:glycogen(starch) synthase